MIARFIRAYFGLFQLNAMGLADSIRATQATDIRTAVDVESSAGKLKIMGGTRPGTKNGSPPAGNPLSTLILNKPSFTVGNGSNGFSTGQLGLITSPGISDTNAANTGTATWARLTDGGDNFVADLSVTASGGGGDVTIDNTSITAGGTVNLTGGTFTVGNA